MQRILCAALSIFALAAGVRADEIRLKDGSKIVGNIVGIEDGAFKIETAYGFAMVRKDSIAEIIPTAPAEAKPAAQKPAPAKPSEDATPAAAPKPATSAKANSAPAASTEAKPSAPGKLVEAAEPKSKPEPAKPAAYVDAKTPSASAARPLPQPTSPKPAAQQPPQKLAAQQPASQQAAAQQPISQQAAAQSAAIPAAPVPPVPAAPVTATNAAPASASMPAAPASASMPAAPAAVPSAPAEPPEPPPVREVVRGNLYINQTYGFQMYRAPDWQPIIAARAALPNAIAALGTSDQSTLLIIGRDRADDSLDAHSAATEKKVEEVYGNYRPMPQQRIMVAGVPAIERQFRGEAERREWSVILVTLERDGDVFTILAMTDANSELVQIQENVIAKAIASLQFTDTAAPAVPHT